jgi:hypothetical protein
MKLLFLFWPFLSMGDFWLQASGRHAPMQKTE